MKLLRVFKYFLILKCPESSHRKHKQCHNYKSFVTYLNGLKGLFKSVKTSVIDVPSFAEDCNIILDTLTYLYATTEDDLIAYSYISYNSLFLLKIYLVLAYMKRLNLNIPGNDDFF